MRESFEKSSKCLIAHLFRFYQQFDGVESLMAVLTRCSVFKDQCRLVTLVTPCFYPLRLTQSLAATRNNISHFIISLQAFFSKFIICFSKKFINRSERQVIIYHTLSN